MRTASAGLLPEGLRDVLPPYAEAEALLLRQLLDVATSHGYERVSPPLVEFQESLVGQLGSERARDLFRFTDPLSHESLGLRSDMTEQVARIASTRLAHSARPLRLCYGGPVLQVQGTQLRPDRQATQVGAELIGAASVAAVGEIIVLALEGLKALGLDGLSLDITMPTWTHRLVEAHVAPASRAAVLTALDAKDRGSLTALGADKLTALVDRAGLAEQALTALNEAGLGREFATALADVRAVLNAVRVRHPDVQTTLDPAEQRRFNYQSWIGFSIFCTGVRDEIGRGGAYDVQRLDASLEPAVGFSLYLDGLVDAGRGVQTRERIFLPAGTAWEAGAALRARGMVTVPALDDGDPFRAAKTLRCTAVWQDDTLVAVTE